MLCRISTSSSLIPSVYGVYSTGRLESPGHLSWRGHRSAAGAVAGREHLARYSRLTFPLAPLSRVSARDFREPRTCIPGGAGAVQVSVDDRRGTISDVPVRGSLGTAPLREFRVPQDPRWRADEREVVHKHGRQAGIAIGEPAPRYRKPGRTPGLTARVGVRVQQQLVRAYHTRRVRPGQRRFLGRGAIRPEGGVLEQAQRRDRDRAARPMPYGVGILRGDDPHPPAQVHQVLVALLAPHV